jgi:DNA-binding IclR family transcriptional regulator
LADEEAEPGVSAIAVVVRDKGLSEGQVVGCLSIGGPTTACGENVYWAFSQL